jgi:riboflavin synthase alpha subunit
MEKTGGMLAFDAIPETLAKTTIGELVVGSRVHLEASATMATLLGGHLVQGHVDGVGVVKFVKTAGEWRARIEVPSELAEFFAPKGSVCVQGVSLTVMALDARERWFEIALIPTTLAKTTLGELREGSRVNVECDAIGKQVVYWLKQFGGARG